MFLLDWKEIVSFQEKKRKQINIRINISQTLICTALLTQVSGVYRVFYRWLITCREKRTNHIRKLTSSVSVNCQLSIQGDKWAFFLPPSSLIESWENPVKTTVIFQKSKLFHFLKMFIVKAIFPVSTSLIRCCQRKAGFGCAVCLSGNPHDWGEEAATGAAGTPLAGRVRCYCSRSATCDSCWLTDESKVRNTQLIKIKNNNKSISPTLTIKSVWETKTKQKLSWMLAFKSPQSFCAICVHWSHAGYHHESFIYCQIHRKTQPGTLI